MKHICTDCRHVDYLHISRMYCCHTMCDRPSMILPVRPLASTKTPRQTSEQIDRSSSISFLISFFFGFCVRHCSAQWTPPQITGHIPLCSASDSLRHVYRFHRVNHCFIYGFFLTFCINIDSFECPNVSTRP